MIDPPQPESKAALQSYLQATKEVNGVVQATLQRYSNIDSMQKQLAHEWKIFFTEEEQQKIVVAYAIRRLA